MLNAVRKSFSASAKFLRTSRRSKQIFHHLQDWVSKFKKLHADLGLIVSGQPSYFSCRLRSFKTSSTLPKYDYIV